MISHERNLYKLMKAAEDFLSVSQPYFSDSDYDADGLLAESQAELSVLLYSLKKIYYITGR